MITPKSFLELSLPYVIESKQFKFMVYVCGWILITFLMTAQIVEVASIKPKLNVFWLYQFSINFAQL